MVTSSTGSYTVLARRFRPEGFADVVGQEHVAQALRNAILANRVAHAYLFTGARGVGKTSTARILAKALNCPNSVAGDPCNDCEICNGIAAGNDVDVMEIDGASNRGIDDIRQLRANVNVKSMRTQYKLYIIDEVHMLTKEAFNALLKTLEEPPPNVKFVFCTTEPNKVPDTILSRCQRFDFGTIETSNIKVRLAHIADAEGVEVDDEALELVARRAAGSMRDSQSIFDQLLAFGEEHISAADVHRLLGTASDDRLIDIGQALVDRDKAKVIDSFHAALDSGVQLGELTDQLLFYLRDLMILASEAKSVDLLAVAPVSRASLQKQADAWGLQTIVAAMQILSDTKGRMQRVTYGRALAELALIRIAMLEELTGIGELIEKLRSGEPATPGPDSSQSEKKNDVEEGESVVAAEHPESKPLSAENTTVSESQVSASSDEPAEVPVVAEAAAVPETADLNPGLHAVTDEATALEAAVSQDVPEPPVVESSTPVSKVIELPESPTVAECEELKPSTPEESVAQTPQNEASELSGGTSELAPNDENSVAQILFSPENSAKIWELVAAEINDMLKSHVKSVSFAAISAPNKLELTLPSKYHFGKRYLEKPDAQTRLEKIVARLTGVTPRITVVLGSEDAADAKLQDAEADGRQATRVFKPEDDELVCSVVEIFSAQVVRTTVLGGGSGAGE